MRISDWSSDVCSSDLIAVVGLPARTPMDEAFAEPGPGIDLKQEIGDLHARQSVKGSATGNLGGGWRCRFQRRDDKAAFVKPDLGQLDLSGEDRHLLDRKSHRLNSSP